MDARFCLFNQPLIRALILVCATLTASCAVDTTALGDGIDLDVQPRFFCAGDSTNISWDFSNTPRDPANCEFPNGGLSSQTVCEITAECPAGVSCLDGGCCQTGVPSQECGASQASNGGCLPDLGLTITTDGIELVPEQDGPPPQPRGSRQVVTTESTLFIIEAGYSPPLTQIAPTPEFQTTLVEPSPGSDITLDFPYTCAGETGVYRSQHTGEGSENVAVAGVTNTTPNTIRVTNSLGESAATLRPGERTDIFNGKLGTRWSVNLAPSDPASSVPTRCTPVDVENPKPDLQITLNLVCEAP
ncbi:hypothetical protein ACTXGQ_18030 [Marinobacter sp. 1Y8]